MKIPRELKTALAACTVVIGAAFSSGREVSSFFACAGWASWIGILLSSAAFGCLMGMLCDFAIRTGARTLGEIYVLKLDQRCGDAIGVVHTLLMLVMGAVAMSNAAELGCLLIDSGMAHIISSGLALFAALLVMLRGMRPLSAVGAVTVPLTVLFFILLAADPRAPRSDAYIHINALDLRGNVPVTVLLAILFAFLKSAISGGVAVSQARGLRPGLLALFCGGIMAALLCSINFPLQKFGRALWSLNLPVVLLAARWGIAGYYACVIMMYLGCVSMLAGALGTLSAQFSASVSRPAALLMTAAAISLISAVGMRSLVSVGYPMLGYMCAISLGVLALFWERKSRRELPAPSNSGFHFTE